MQRKPTQVKGKQTGENTDDAEEVAEKNEELQARQKAKSQQKNGCRNLKLRVADVEKQRE